MLKSHRATVEMRTMANAKFLEDSTKTIHASEKILSETNEKLEKLLHNVRSFMAEFRSSTDSNTEAMNKVITRFWTSLKAKKEAFSIVFSKIKQDNIELNASVVSKIEKLQSDLAAENNLMDKLAEKTAKAKVLLVKL